MWSRAEKIPDRKLSLIIASAILLGILVIFLPVVLVGISQVTSSGETLDTKRAVLRSKKSSKMTLITWKATCWIGRPGMRLTNSRRKSTRIILMAIFLIAHWSTSMFKSTSSSIHLVKPYTRSS